MLLNRKDGIFAPVEFYSTGVNTTATSLVLGDVNGDGYSDAIVANDLFGPSYGGNSTAGVLLNNHDGTFAPVVAYSTGRSGYLTGIALGDLNSDNYPDIVMTNTISNVAIVLLNQQNGTFAANYSVDAGSSPQNIALGDVNKDGYLDLLITNYRIAGSGNVGVLLNRKDGTFAPIVSYAMGNSSSPYGVAVGDVNGDSYPDLVLANTLSGTAGVLLNRKDGTFAEIVAYSTGVSTYTSGITLGDINGDGFPDIVAANGNASTVGVLLNKRDGTFATVVAYSVGAGSAPRSVVVSDANKDGKLDIVVSKPKTNFVGVLLNQAVPLAALPGSALPQVQVACYPNLAFSADNVRLAVANLPTTVSRVDATVLTLLAK